MLRLVRQRTHKQKYAKREFPQMEFIPYKCHWNNRTILTKSDDLLQVIKFSGFSFETADDEDVDIRKNIRNLLLKGIGAGQVSLYFHIVRRRKAAFSKDEGHMMPPGFATYLEDVWREKHLNQQSFVNELYVTVIKKNNKTGIAAIGGVLKKLQQKTDKVLWGKDMWDSYEELDEMTSRIVSTLRDYKPDVLGVVETKNGVYSEILEFLGTLVNCGHSC